MPGGATEMKALATFQVEAASGAPNSLSALSVPNNNYDKFKVFLQKQIGL